MRVLLSVLMLMCVVTAFAQKPNRHGPNNGTVRQLPAPRLSETQTEAMPPTELLALPGQDAVIDQIEADYQAEATQLDLQIRNTARGERRKLDQQCMLLKIDRDRAILYRIRELASERNDADAMAKIDVSLEQLAASTERISSAKNIQPIAAKKISTPATKLNKMAGEEPQEKSAGGAQ